MRRHDVSVYMFKRDAYVRLSVERHDARDHFVERDPDGINVRALVGKAASRLLGRQIMHRTGAVSSGFSRPFRHGAGNSEVCEFYPAFVGYKYILRFYVSVYDTVAVGAVDRGQYLGANIKRVPPAH